MHDWKEARQLEMNLASSSLQNGLAAKMKQNPNKFLDDWEVKKL